MKKESIVLLVFLLVGFLFSSTTGKIKGEVTDDAGEPIMAANVVLEGTTKGASTGKDGTFHILGVKAGTYNVKCSFTGFSTVVKKKVKVSIGLTTELNFVLKEQDFVTSEEVIVLTHDEKKVDLSKTTTTLEMNVSEIADGGTSVNIDDVLETQTGIEKDADGDIHIRGGAGEEVKYLMDGTDVTDPTGEKTTGGSAMDGIDFSNVASFSIMKGVLPAEYGDALSGQVNLVMKVGDQKKTSGAVRYETDAFLNKETTLDYHGGTFSLNGPIPIPGLEFKPTYFVSLGLNTQNGSTDSYRKNGKFMEGDFFEYSDYDIMGLGFKMPQKRKNSFSFLLKNYFELSQSMNLTSTFQKQKNHNISYSWLNRYSPETAYEIKDNQTIFSLNLQHALSQNSYYSLTFSYYNRRLQRLPGSKTPDRFTLREELDGYSIVDINGNGIRDGGDAEGYLDVNGNGYFDREFFIDENGDGKWSSNEVIDTVLAEPYYDANRNGKYDGDVLFDSNGNNKWDYWENGKSYTGFAPAQNALLTNGKRVNIGGTYATNMLQGIIVEGYVDRNGSGHYEKDIYNVSKDEPYVDGDKWNSTGEPFIDQLFPVAVTVPNSSGGKDTIITFRANYKYDEVRTAKIKVDDADKFFSDNWKGDKYNTFEEALNYYQKYYDGLIYFIKGGYYQISYPSEEYLDLKATYTGYYGGNANNSNMRYNASYDNPAVSKFFKEYEAYCSIRTMGESNDPSLLGWNGNHTVYTGSYVVYTKPDNDNLKWTQLKPDSKSTWVDRNKNGKIDFPNGKYDKNEQLVDYNNDGTFTEDDGFATPGTFTGGGTDYMSNDISTYKLTGNFVSQIGGDVHELKLGFEGIYNDLDFYKIEDVHLKYQKNDSLANDKYPDQGSKKTIYHFKPVEFAFYAQDKMEFQDLVVNVGLRFQSRRHDKDAVDFYKKKQANGDFGYEDKIDQFIFNLSPRLSMSHAISDLSKLFFSYGHVYQKPNYTDVYQPDTEEGSEVLFGNMNLDYQKIVAYELGVQNSFGDYMLDITGYFKDYYDMITTKTYDYGVQKTSIYYNKGYGKTRGIEFSLNKGLSDHYRWNIAYTLGYAYGKTSTPEEELEDGSTSKKENPLDWDQRHSLNLSVGLAYGKGEKLFDVDYLDYWNMSISTSYGSGLPFTPTPEYYNYSKKESEIIKNSERISYTTNTDLKFSKKYDITSGDREFGTLRFDFSIFNLFSRRNVERVYRSTGKWDNPGASALENKESLRTAYADPTRRSEKRHYRFGISYNF